MTPLCAPSYKAQPGDVRVGLAVEDMKRHTTNEGWEIFAGLEYTGYQLAGYNLPFNETNVKSIVCALKPDVVVLQDKREWDVVGRNFREKKARFYNAEYLAEREDIFKLTIVKDSHHNPAYHRHSAEEIGCHGWIIYYHPSIVCKLAPYIRPEHAIRVYHTVDSDAIPNYTAANRKGCLLSGAVSGVYPLRRRLRDEVHKLPDTDTIRHPGYHRRGSATPGFLKTLSGYKVAICTASSYGYALRKIIEATAAGCIVVTDLPAFDVLPHIDDNLVRVTSDISTEDVAALLSRLYEVYDPERQAHFAELAKCYYDYRIAGLQLNLGIEHLRNAYNVATTC